MFRHPPPLLRVGLLLVGVLAYGATGFLYYELPEHPTLTWADGIWYAIVTVSTVGYGDFSPSSVGGRFLVAAPMMFFGIGLLGYVLSLAASALVEQKSKETHGMSQFAFTDHLVICNFPNLGILTQLLDELEADASFKLQNGVVLIDNKLTEVPQELARRDVRFVRGDPSSDETLSRANASRASAAIILSKPLFEPTADMATVAIALALTTAAPNILLVAQCVEPMHEPLLRKAKCTHVVCTGRFGAHFVATELLNPGAQDVLADLTSAQGGEQLYVSRFGGADCSIGELKVQCAQHRHLLVGIRRDATTQLNPADEFTVTATDSIITIGPTRLRLA